MSYTVMLELPDNIAQNAHQVAMQTERSITDVLLAWLDQAVTEIPVEELSDEQVLALNTMELETSVQAELSDLLALNREGTLPDRQRRRLDELMQIYRHNLVRKAAALKVAVDRGLRPPLNTQAN
ncbi:MAG: hypothetical protein R3E79_27175 [Caldilineaceae bacterium]